MDTELNLEKLKLEKKLTPNKFPKFSESTFSIVQLSTLFGVSRPSLYEMIKNGTFEASGSSKRGTIETPVFSWQAIEKIAKHLGPKVTKPINKKVKVFANLKGGVGKSTLAAQFAMTASCMGIKTLVIDLDPQAHATKIIHYEDHHLMDLPTLRDVIISNKTPAAVIQKITSLLDLIPANLSLAMLEMELLPKANREQKVAAPIKLLREQYDLIVIDTNPSPSSVNISAIIASDEICIVTETDKLSTEGMASIFQVLQQIDEDFQHSPPARVIANKFDVREGMAQRSIGFLRENYGDVLVKTVVNKNQALKEAQARHITTWQYNKRSSGAQDILNLTKDLINESEV